MTIGIIHRSLADVLASPGADLDPTAVHAAQREWRRLLRSVLLPLAVVAALVGAWIATAPLAGAVVAPARLKVELNRKTVQHQEGGIVREILVRDGQTVRAGEALLVVADTVREADLRLLQDRRLATLARQARTEAEARLAPRYEPPAALLQDAAAAGHVAAERAVFAARRQALDEQTTSLQAQVRQTEAQATALASQLESTGVSVRLSDEELAINEKLVEQGFVQRTRLIGLQRISADYRSRIGEHQSDLAAARQRADELRSRIAQWRQQYLAQAADEGRQAAATLREIDEKLTASQDHVDRQTVRAPVDGQVMSLRVAAVGAVVAPREPLLDVVPVHERLVVDARIAPQDIEHMHVGAAAQVRLLGAEARLLPPLPARVLFVSPDRVNGSDGESGRAWFEVTVSVDAAAVQQQRPALRLQPGMPAELYVTTGERSLFEYLARPLGLLAKRALREP